MRNQQHALLAVYPRIDTSPPTVTTLDIRLDMWRRDWVPANWSSDFELSTFKPRRWWHDQELLLKDNFLLSAFEYTPIHKIILSTNMVLAKENIPAWPFSPERIPLPDTLFQLMWGLWNLFMLPYLCSSFFGSKFLICIRVPGIAGRSHDGTVECRSMENASQRWLNLAVDNVQEAETKALEESGSYSAHNELVLWVMCRRKATSASLNWLSRPAVFCRIGVSCDRAVVFFASQPAYCLSASLRIWAALPVGGGLRLGGIEIVGLDRLLWPRIGIASGWWIVNPLKIGARILLYIVQAAAAICLFTDASRPAPSSASAMGTAEWFESTRRRLTFDMSALNMVTRVIESVGMRRRALSWQTPSMASEVKSSNRILDSSKAVQVCRISPWQ